jgi:hypothetical protein
MEKLIGYAVLVCSLLPENHLPYDIVNNPGSGPVVQTAVRGNHYGNLCIVRILTDQLTCFYDTIYTLLSDVFLQV